MPDQKVARFSLSELIPELIKNEIFLSEAEEYDEDIRAKLAASEDDEEAEEPYDVIKAVLEDVESSDSSLYDTYISSDTYGQYIKDWEVEWKKYWNRYQVFGFGGLYWILDNETQESEHTWGREFIRTFYVRYDDAVSDAEKDIESSCDSYLNGNDNYQEPSIREVADIAAYKAKHDLIIRPASLPSDYCGASRRAKEDKIEVIRLAFHEKEFENNDWEFVERLCELQYVLSSSPAWKERHLVVAIDGQAFPADPRRLSTSVVQAMTDSAWEESVISVRPSGKHHEPVIELDEPAGTPYGYEFVMPVTDDRQLNALKVFILEKLQLGMYSTASRIYYRKDICDKELAELETLTQSIALFDDTHKDNLSDGYDFVLDPRLYDTNVWKPSLFLAAEAPLPKKESKAFLTYLKTLLDAGCHALNRFSETSYSDSDLSIGFEIGKERMALTPHGLRAWHTGKGDYVWIEDQQALNMLESAESPVLHLSGWHQGHSLSVRFDIDDLRYELQGTPVDRLVHYFFDTVSEALSFKLNIRVGVIRSDYLRDEDRREQDRDEFSIRYRYPSVTLDHHPDTIFVQELALEVWRVLDNIAAIPVDEAIEMVMRQAEGADRFRYEDRQAVRKAVFDCLVWNFANPQAPDFLHGRYNRRRGTLTRAFGLNCPYAFSPSGKRMG